MKVLLDSRELFDIVNNSLSKDYYIEEIIVKIDMFNMIVIDDEGNVKPYGNEEVIIKKENNE